MAEINTGDMVRITASFTNASGVAADPTGVTLTVRLNGVDTNYTLAGGQVVKDSVGNYHYDLSIPSDESMYKIEYRWQGTGAVTAAEEGMFYAVSRF